MDKQQLIEAIRTQFKQGKDFYFAIKTYHQFKELYPEESLPADLADVEEHCKIPLQSYIGARKQFEQYLEPGRKYIDDLLVKKKYDKIKAICENALSKDPYCGPALKALAEMDFLKTNNIDVILQKLNYALQYEPGRTRGNELRTPWWWRRR